MLEILFFVPLLAGCTMLLLNNARICRILLLGTAFTHFLASVAVIVTLHRQEPLVALGGLLAPDALGSIFLMLASVLFVATALYAIGYLKDEEALHARQDAVPNMHDGSPFTNAPERRFTACLCFFLAAMTLVTTTPHLGALWVGIELTTLSSAPLIYFHRHQRSMEATWKYLMICSVGIALALLGNILLSVAFHNAGHGESINQLGEYLRLASNLNQGENSHAIPWLKAAFVFIIVGYGTKMGLAPLHNWLPDAHSQAPSLVSGLLSGALLNCAFLGILRGHQIMLAAQLGHFSSSLLIFFGLLSMCVAAIFIVGQGYYKRLLAYSSVEHMGILALGVGLGGGAVFGAMYHAVCHSLTKCMLFLLAGNILSRYQTLSSYEVRGLRWTMPMTGALWLAGFLAIVGSPPFGLFVSELTILQSMFAQNAHPLIPAIYLGALAVIFVGMSVPVLRMVQGNRPLDIAPTENFSESASSVLPPLGLGVLVITLGLYTPHWLSALLERGASLLGG